LLAESLLISIRGEWKSHPMIYIIGIFSPNVRGFYYGFHTLETKNKKILWGFAFSNILMTKDLDIILQMAVTPCAAPIIP
jgi:hypothetical protein